MNNAYMIRNDGEAFPVKIHIYGNVEEIEETLYASEWYYSHTLHKELKPLIIRFICAYYKFSDSIDMDAIIDSILTKIKNTPYKVISKEFITAHQQEILNAWEDTKKSDLDLNTLLVNELNQEFLRARFGGVFNSSASSKEMTFRISSTGFNWYNIIWEFVYKNSREIKTVTIVRDEESTGTYFEYKNRSGENYFNMPIEDFLTEKGNPVVESKDIVKGKLQKGKSLTEIYRSSLNKERIQEKLYRYRYHERKTKILC